MIHAKAKTKILQQQDMCYVAMSISKVTQHCWKMNDLGWVISEMMLTGYNTQKTTLKKPVQYRNWLRKKIYKKALLANKSNTFIKLIMYITDVQGSYKCA